MLIRDILDYILDNVWICDVGLEQKESKKKSFFDETLPNDY